MQQGGGAAAYTRNKRADESRVDRKNALRTLQNTAENVFFFPLVDSWEANVLLELRSDFILLKFLHWSGEGHTWQNSGVTCDCRTNHSWGCFWDYMGCWRLSPGQLH